MGADLLEERESGREREKEKEEGIWKREKRKWEILKYK